MSIMCSVETKDWVWFEEGLAYDNARLSQALIVTGISLGASPLRSGRLEILALAYDVADFTDRPLPTCRLRQFRCQA